MLVDVPLSDVWQSASYSLDRACSRESPRAMILATMGSERDEGVSLPVAKRQNERRAGEAAGAPKKGETRVPVWTQVSTRSQSFDGNATSVRSPGAGLKALCGISV